MKPEDLLNPENFPDDLKWVHAHQRLHPNDPVYLLIAWHWQRVNKSEDTLTNATAELKAGLDHRLAELKATAESIGTINAALAKVQETLAQKPAILGQELEAKLTQPVAAAAAKLASLEKSLTPIARSFETSQRRQILATLLIGVAFGLIAAAILLRG
jgi:chromosome segregation ATPase